MAARKQGRTNFAATCSLLSQYIKEKGSIADLGLGMAPRPQGAAKGKSEASRPPTTMRLLPGADVSSEEEDRREMEMEGVSHSGNAIERFPQRTGFGPSPAAVPEDAREPESAQLTIFYGGKVLVFDNFPAEKANDLLQLASKGNSSAQNFGYVSPSSAMAVASSRDQNSTLLPKAANILLVPTSAQPSLSYLPIARKASLQRFLEKRKDRVNARAPYQVTASSEMVTHVKQENIKSWLGLGPQLSFPCLSLSSAHSG